MIQRYSKEEGHKLYNCIDPRCNKSGHINPKRKGHFSQKDCSLAAKKPRNYTFTFNHVLGCIVCDLLLLLQ